MDVEHEHVMLLSPPENIQLYRKYVEHVHRLILSAPEYMLDGCGA
jgi:hypothetical protein